MNLCSYRMVLFGTGKFSAEPRVPGGGLIL